MATPTSLPGSFSALTPLAASTMNNLRGAFRVLQVVSTTKTDTFTTTSTTYVDVTGLSVSITPQSTDSKILVFASLSGTGATGLTNFFAQLVRGSTAIGVGATAGSRRSATSGVRDQSFVSSLVLMHLDSPSTTAATTYKVQIAAQGTQLLYVNRGESDTDAIFSPRTASSITVMEISA